VARITVEDCTRIIPSRFELVLLAAQRAREISAGNPILLPEDNDKKTVIALREIAEGLASRVDLRSAAITRLQKYVQSDEDWAFEQDAFRQISAKDVHAMMESAKEGRRVERASAAESDIISEDTTG